MWLSRSCSNYLREISVSLRLCYGAISCSDAAHTDGDWAIVVLVLEVREHNLVYIAVTAAGTTPRLDARTILRVLDGNVVDVHIPHNIYVKDTVYHELRSPLNRGTHLFDHQSLQDFRR